MSTKKKSSSCGMPNEDILGALSVPAPASYHAGATAGVAAATSSAAAAASAGSSGDMLGTYDDPYGDDYNYNDPPYGDAYDDYDYNNVDYSDDEFGENEKYLEATAAASGQKKNVNKKNASNNDDTGRSTGSVPTTLMNDNNNNHNNRKSKGEEKVDCNGVIEINSDDDNDDAGDVRNTAINSTAGVKKRKRSRKKPPPSSSEGRGYADRIKDAIAVDDDDDDDRNDLDGKAGAKSKEELKVASYRSSLGPLRMVFVPSGVLKNHTFANGVSKTGYFYSNSSNVGGPGGGGGRGGHGGAHATGGRGRGRGSSSSAASTMNNSSTVHIRKLHREYIEYALNLPAIPQGAIFCRVGESRLDLCRVLMTGPEDTPYANGCFLFDFCMADYPVKPPSAKFLTTGSGSVRFNPNLYNCGKVCLSLLGTWSGPGWVPNQSTLLQVLVSIQGLILVSEPYYNEPGWEMSRGTTSGKKQSDLYNKNIRLQTLRWGILDPLNKTLNYLLNGIKVNNGRVSDTTSTSKTQKDPASRPIASSCASDYQEFALVVVKHFHQKAEEIESQLSAWTKLDNSVQSIADTIRLSMKKLLDKEEKEWEDIASNIASSSLLMGVSKDEQAAAIAAASAAVASSTKIEAAPTANKKKKTISHAPTVDLTYDDDDGVKETKLAAKSTAEVIEIL